VEQSSSFPAGIDFGWKRMNILITKHHGQKTLWKSRSKLLEIPAGTILPDPVGAWEGKTPLLIKVDTPEFYSTYYSLDVSGKLAIQSPRIPTGLVCKRYIAHSKDKTKVQYLTCYKKNTKPTKLLAIGYGAYGMPTSVNSMMKGWAPLFHTGWVLVTTFLRGGGDHTESWAKEGQLEGREKTIDDFEACILSAQKRFGISAKKTAIYGRSAGGLLLGGTLKRHPNGSLMSAIYAEVPYVDELRTTTNPELPLTVLEYKEFGNPLHSLKDFINVGLLSPANSAAVLGSPEVFVLSRTAENDSQVFPYESVKWIRRLREHDKPSDAPKLCIVDKDQGHFATPDQMLRERALDLAYLDAWMVDALKKYSM
jgi:oligopeptidase B